jgi:hypothetical protein
MLMAKLPFAKRSGQDVKASCGVFGIFSGTLQFTERPAHFL